ncbi:hypothetical protein H5410_060926 [Solanum commersonii]|uniref:Uncharacterized protein n=1 Tax=Solanum commersonii TaxID=4109 RepID=A0A9J5W7J9_SOLCO|nr:hypothetical protein H5410_060926 [Solanum commersonii]
MESPVLALVSFLKYYHDFDPTVILEFDPHAILSLQYLILVNKLSYSRVTNSIKILRGVNTTSHHVLAFNVKYDITTVLHMSIQPGFIMY